MSAVLTLSPVLDIQAVAELKDRLLAVRGQDLEVDASEIERLGGLCLQVLLAARNAWEADGHAFAFVRPSDAFTDQWISFGADLPVQPLGDA